MDTWWIDEPTVAGSSNPSDEDLEALFARGFSVVVSLLDPPEQGHRYDKRKAIDAGWTWHNIRIRDFGAPSLDQVRQFVALVGSSVPEKRVLVHCEGGSGRTGTMAAAYWIARGMETGAAIERIRRDRPHAVETLEQEAVLCEFAASLSGVGSAWQD